MTPKSVTDENAQNKGKQDEEQRGWFKRLITPILTAVGIKVADEGIKAGKEALETAKEEGAEKAREVVTQAKEDK